MQILNYNEKSKIFCLINSSFVFDNCSSFVQEENENDKPVYTAKKKKNAHTHD
jgi:hypothetical protein